MGFPIRTSTDRSLLGSSPWLFAASHVLHRLLAPEHPPCTLCSLATISLPLAHHRGDERVRSVLVTHFQVSHSALSADRDLTPPREATQSASRSIIHSFIRATGRVPSRREARSCHYSDVRELIRGLPGARFRRHWFWLSPRIDEARPVEAGHARRGSRCCRYVKGTCEVVCSRRSDSRHRRKVRVVLDIPRKEVIQPQVLLRLPCYDLVPVTRLTVVASLPKVGLTTLGTPGFRGLTGGVYKAQEHIHRGIADPRLLAIPPSCRRISAYNPN